MARYYVYVIEASRNGRPIYYVGQSAKRPAERLREHEEGVRYCATCTKRTYIRDEIVRLRPDMYRGLVYRTRPEAEAGEKRLARELRSLGYRVTGGH